MGKSVGFSTSVRRGPKFRFNEDGDLQVWSGTWKDVGSVPGGGGDGHSPVTALDASIFVGNDQQLAVNIRTDSMLSLAAGGIGVSTTIAGLGLYNDSSQGYRRLSLNVAAASGLAFSGSQVLLGTPLSVGVGTTNSIGTGHGHLVINTNNGKAVPSTLLSADSSGYLTLTKLISDILTVGTINTPGITDLYITPAGGTVYVTGDIDFVGDRNIGGNGSVTINPTDEITLGGSDVGLSSLIHSTGWNGFDRGLSNGWGVTTAGRASFKELHADEFTVSSFVYDAALVRPNSLYVTPSAAILSQPYELPELPELTDPDITRFYIYDVPGFEGIPAFSDMDFVLFEDRTLTAQTKVWGVVSDYNDEGDGEQSWLFEVKSPDDYPGGAIGKGATVLDYGKSGSGFWFAEATNGSELFGGPRSGVAEWVGSAPYIPGAIQPRAIQGSLFAITGINEYGFLGKYGRGQFVMSSKRNSMTGIPYYVAYSSGYKVLIKKAYLEFTKSQGPGTPTETGPWRYPMYTGDESTAEELNFGILTPSGSTVNLGPSNTSDSVRFDNSFTYVTLLSGGAGPLDGNATAEDMRFVLSGNVSGDMAGESVRLTVQLARFHKNTGRLSLVSDAYIAESLIDEEDSTFSATVDMSFFMDSAGFTETDDDDDYDDRAAFVLSGEVIASSSAKNIMSIDGQYGFIKMGSAVTDNPVEDMIGGLSLGLAYRNIGTTPEDFQYGIEIDGVSSMLYIDDNSFGFASEFEDPDDYGDLGGSFAILTDSSGGVYNTSISNKNRGFYGPSSMNIASYGDSATDPADSSYDSGGSFIGISSSHSMGSYFSSASLSIRTEVTDVFLGDPDDEEPNVETESAFEFSGAPVSMDDSLSVDGEGFVDGTFEIGHDLVMRDEVTGAAYSFRIELYRGKPRRSGRRLDR